MDEEDLKEEEISQEQSLKQKSSPSLKQSCITHQTVTSIIEEEDNESAEDDEGVTRFSGSAQHLEIDPETEKLEEETKIEDEFLKNPGLNQAYKPIAVKPLKEEDDEAVYLRLVKEAKIMPIKRISSGFTRSAIHLQYFGLNCMQLKPLSEALMNNTSVKELNLKSNNLNLDALYHLGLMLRRNVCLSTLNLSQCKITAEGMELLSNGLEICPHLAYLDLSYNDFGDKGMEILAVKLCYNTSITNLNLSHNNLTHKTGIYLAETMEENYSLHHIDLSWNQMAEDQGLKKFLYAAVEHNDSILSLDLSWNTLSGEKTANIIKTFIGQHKSLQEFNLSHNRLETAAEVTKIAKGINTAPNLKVLNLSYNGITADTAFALLNNINTKAKLKTLRLDNVWVKPEFEKLRRELESEMEIKIIIQGVTGGFATKGPDMQTLLLKRAHHLGYLPKKPKNKKDFGWFLLRLQKTGNLVPVKKAKFENLVVEDKIKFDEGMVDEIAKRFKDENKKIDLNLMLEKYLSLYPETALPIPKEKKKIKVEKKQSKKISEAGLPEKIDRKMEGGPKEETKESKEEEIRKSLEDIPGLQIKEQSRESYSQTKFSDKSKDEIKEIEAAVDEEINIPQLPEEGKNDTEQMIQDNKTEENIKLKKHVKIKDKNVEEGSQSREKVEDEIVKEEQEEEEKSDEEKDKELDNPVSKWRVVRSLPSLKFSSK